MCLLQVPPPLRLLLFPPFPIKYVLVLYIRDTETSEEHRVAVEFAQFIPVTKYYDQELSDWKASMNKFSTVRNNGPGKETRKRKAAGNGSKASKAKRSPLQEFNAQTSNFEAATQPTSSSTATLPATYSNPCYNPQFNYQDAQGIAQHYSHQNYINQQHHSTHNYNYLPTPMVNYSPTVPNYTAPMTYSQPQTVAPNTQLHDENSNFVQMYLGPQFH